MNIFLITVVTVILAFLFGVVFRKTVEKRPFKVGGYKIHHSILGVLLFIAGVLVGNRAILSIGLGIYLSHGIEEMYFEKTRLPKAFFVFITRR